MVERGRGKQSTLVIPVGVWGEAVGLLGLDGPPVVRVVGDEIFDECRPLIGPTIRVLFGNYAEGLITPPAEQVFCSQNDCCYYISSDRIN